MELGNSVALTVGEPAVIVGSPRGLEGTVTAGILSSVRDSGDGFKVLRTDASVNPGNSGGPLVNNKGQVIGVVSFKFRSAEGLNFAIPINYVRGLLNNLHAPMTLDQMRKSLMALPTSPQKSNGWDDAAGSSPKRLTPSRASRGSHPSGPWFSAGKSRTSCPYSALSPRRYGRRSAARFRKPWKAPAQFLDYPSW